MADCPVPGARCPVPGARWREQPGTARFRRRSRSGYGKRRRGPDEGSVGGEAKQTATCPAHRCSARRRGTVPPAGGGTLPRRRGARRRRARASGTAVCHGRLRRSSPLELLAHRPLLCDPSGRGRARAHLGDQWRQRRRRRLDQARRRLRLPPHLCLRQHRPRPERPGRPPADHQPDHVLRALGDDRARLDDAFPHPRGQQHRQLQRAPTLARERPRRVG